VDPRPCFTNRLNTRRRIITRPRMDTCAGKRRRFVRKNYVPVVVTNFARFRFCNSLRSVFRYRPTYEAIFVAEFPIFPIPIKERRNNRNDDDCVSVGRVRARMRGISSTRTRDDSQSSSLFVALRTFP